MSTKNIKLSSLLIEEQKLLKNINENHKKSKSILSNNLHLRSDLKIIRQQILDIISPQLNEGLTLYQIVKSELGVVDGRYNKIYDLVTRTGKIELN